MMMMTWVGVTQQDALGTQKEQISQIITGGRV